MSGGEHKPTPAGFSGGFKSGSGWALGFVAVIIVFLVIIIGLASSQPIPGNSGAAPQTVIVEQEPETNPPRSEPEPEDTDTVCYFETTRSICNVSEAGADLRLGISNRPGLYICWYPKDYSVFKSIEYYKDGDLHPFDTWNLPSGVEGYRVVPKKSLRMTLWLQQTPCPSS